MSSKLPSLATTRYVILTRIFVIIIGCIAVTWGLGVFPVFWWQSSIERIASRIIEGEPFRVETLAGQIPIIDSIEGSAYCRPAALRSAAIIQLHKVEAATSADAQEHVNVHLNSLGNMIRSSLSCSPADPFLWLVLYWVESTENGSKPDYLKYLRMSYRLGPNEGWIELKRNHIAFAIFEQLPLDLAENTIDEFVALLEMGQYEQVVKTFTSQAWRVRDLLLLRLKNVADQYRRAFSNALYSRGYDVDVPGIKRPDPRPWD